MKALICLGGVLLLFTVHARAEDKWTIHEWGTFTSLQNETGESIGGINTDDEALPPFVHRVQYAVVLQPTEMPATFSKGIQSCHPDVTMRLETPVIYFHPPASQKRTEIANVTVKFLGGWLTEYYPYADPSAPGLNVTGSEFSSGGLFRFAHLCSGTEGKLEWNGLKIGGDWALTNTTAHVWTSPRAVQAASVQTVNSESEKFLFYRGVGHIDAPLKVTHDTNSGDLLFRSQLKDLPINKPLTIRSLWLVNIRKDGKVAFRLLPSVSIDHNTKKILTHTAPAFEASDFSSSNLEKLKTSLQTALVTDGLFADEAQALLNTWELSYFKSSGLRVFFLVPRAWTDFYLPLDISLPADINRVMVGRIELVTSEQRDKLMEISRFSAAKIQSDLKRMSLSYVYSRKASGGRIWEQLYSGEKPLSSVVSVPKTYQTYLDLGRFRNALILDEERRHSTPGLTNFISLYRLGASKPVENPSVTAN